MHWTAPFSLLVGLLSPLALADPLWWFVPVIGVISSVVAFRCVDSSHRRLIHRLLPACGLTISLLFGTWGPARQISRNAQVSTQAEDFCRQWIRMIQAGRLQEAHQMCMPPHTRATDSRLMIDMYKSQDKLEKLYRDFVQEPFVKDINELGEAAELSAGELVEMRMVDNNDEITLNFTLTGAKGTLPVVLRLNIMIRRLQPSTSPTDGIRTSHWEIPSYKKLFD